MIRKICIDEVSEVNKSFSQTVTCLTPTYTPTGAGDECEVAVYNVDVNLGTTPPTLAFSYDTQFEYVTTHQGNPNWKDDCVVTGQSGSLTLPTGLTTCCGFTQSSVSWSASCNPGAITTTPTSVSGPVDINFSVTNLCSPTIICVDDTTCP